MLQNHFPDLIEQLNQGEDYRKRKEYEKAELLLGAIMLFIFKEGSRNAFNTDRAEAKFAKNYVGAFGVRLPHMDTVDTFLRQLKEEELEGIKCKLIKLLLEKRVFHKFRMFKKYFTISVDGTGLASYGEEPYDSCPFRTYKKKKDKQDKVEQQVINKETEAEETEAKKKVWFQPVLEAKLVCRNGFSISICTEWVLNEGEWDKQDCELKAFKRLADSLKSYFPRLPICIVADGLYPNASFFDICKDKQWSFILTLKDGQLKVIWEQVKEFDLLYKENQVCFSELIGDKEKEVICTYRWINEIQYKGHHLNWIECVRTQRNIETGEEQVNRFVHVTNLKVNSLTASEISFHGRLRWKIENEGFNTQKNGGYNLQHKFSRKSLKAIKNYYQALQIAHLINQLVELSATIQQLVKGKVTIKHLWKVLIAFMYFGEITEEQFLQQFQRARFEYG